MPAAKRVANVAFIASLHTRLGRRANALLVRSHRAEQTAAELIAPLLYGSASTTAYLDESVDEGGRCSSGRSGAGPPRPSRSLSSLPASCDGVRSRPRA